MSACRSEGRRQAAGKGGFGPLFRGYITRRCLASCNVETDVELILLFADRARRICRLFYREISRGLAAPAGDHPFYCHDLMSSGSDDDSMLLLFAVFIAPCALRALRLTAQVSKYEIAPFLLAAVMSVIGTTMANLDCADVLYTAFIVPDIPLAAALASIPIAAIILLIQQAKER